MSFDIAGIISGIRTKTELNNLLRELEILESSLYKTGDDDFDYTLLNSVNLKLSEAIRTQLQNDDNNTDPGARKALLEAITNGVNNLKIIKMEIPVEPSQAMIKKIHKWITEKTGAGKIMDLTVDENILGGARITYEGKYADCTLNQVWEDVWKQIGQGTGVSS
jgi:F0F1-type ATP synthase delta subunit